MQDWIHLVDRRLYGELAADSRLLWGLLCNRDHERASGARS
ncbi:hypothetical protein [Streptomyces sp. 7N604]